MDPPLRQTIKSHLAYVNLTDALFKQTFYQFQRTAFLGAQADFCPRRAYRMALWPTRRTLRSLQGAVLYFVFPEASGQTGGSGTTLTHCKRQSGLGSARP
jgi:hypothetical protein